jgi:hypothetical protein
MKNLTKSKVVIVRIFDVDVKSLIFFMNRESYKEREEHNKILIKHEKKVVHRLIKSMLNHDMSLIINLIFSDIVTLECAQNSTSLLES